MLRIDSDPMMAVGPSEQAAATDRQDNTLMRLLFQYVLAVDACCVDIGCSKGHLMKWMLKAAPLGRHVGIEPVPVLAQELREKFQAFPNVTIHELAASNASKTTTFTWIQDNPGYSSFVLRDNPICLTGRPQEIEVRAQPLDELLALEYPGLTPDLIKIDVENAEYQVLEGAIETLTTARPTVLFEHSNYAANPYGGSTGELYDLLTGKPRLRIYSMKGTGPFTRRGFEDAARREWNFIAHP